MITAPKLLNSSVDCKPPLMITLHVFISHVPFCGAVLIFLSLTCCLTVLLQYTLFEQQTPRNIILSVLSTNTLGSDTCYDAL